MAIKGKATKGVKRAASPRQSSPAKKNKGAGDRCKEVIKALKEQGPWSPPAAIISMLCGAVEHTAGVAKEDRHDMQEKVIGWIGDTLATYETGMQKEADEMAAKVIDADGEKAARESKKVEKEGELERLQEAVKAAETAYTEAIAAEKEAASALTSTEKAQVEGDVEYGKAADKKEQLELAEKEAYLPLKERTEPLPGTTVKESIAKLLKVGGEFQFDAALLTSFPSTVTKEPAERGSFDKMVLEQMDGEFKKHVGEQDKLLSEGLAGKESRASAVQKAQSAKEAAQGTCKSTLDALTEAKVAVKDGKDALKEAVRAVKDFGPEMKEMAAASKEAAARVASFKEGPLAAFAALKDPPADPPVEEAAEAVSEPAPVAEETAPVAAA